MQTQLITVLSRVNVRDVQNEFFLYFCSLFEKNSASVQFKKTRFGLDIIQLFTVNAASNYYVYAVVILM